MKSPFILLMLSLLTVAFPLPCRAASDSAPLPFLSPLFTDNMVLQRAQSDPVWGWTTPGALVTVRVAGKGAKAVAGASGKWIVHLPPLPVGGPYTLTISGPQTATLQNVLVGDVWLCSGQSNMEFGMGMTDNSAREIAAANYPQIRLFVTEKKIALDPQSTTMGQWLPCAPDTVTRGTWNGFSAVGCFFGRDLYNNLHVPIGLIQSSWGGTPAEAWTSEPMLAEKLPAFQGALAKIDALRQSATAASAPPPGSAFNQNSPAALYNAMISPLVSFGIKGAIWYQGEANAGRGRQYRTLLPAMITDWRQRWQEGEFPFLIVQLAGWAPGDGAFADIRQAQFEAAQAVPNAGIATAVDIGNENDIHPHNKQEVGHRLALVAEAKVYGEKVEYAGPVYKALKVEGGQARLTFDHLGGGLVAKDGQPLTGFTIAGAEGDFVAADAKIAGETVLVSSPQVPVPVAVRYAWTGYPQCSLYNKAGLPAFPFRTDTAGHTAGLPANAGPNLALGQPAVCSDPNTHGWSEGLTDGSWDAGAPTTFATNEANTFPKTVTVQLKKAAAVSLVAVGVPPFGSTKTITVSLSADGQAFQEVGSYVFSLRKEEKYLFRFAPVSARFVRLTFPDHYDEAVGYPPTFVFATEMEVYAPGPTKPR